MKTRSIYYIRGIVAVGCFAAILLVGLPLVDEYFEHRAAELEVQRMRAEIQEMEELGEASAQEQRRVVRILDELRRRTVTEQEIAETRDEFVAMVRDSGCQIRQIDASEAEKRPWTGSLEGPVIDPMEMELGDNSLQLQTTRISLVVVGRLSAVHRLCQRIASRQFLAATEYMTIQPVEASGESVQMELRIRLYGLVDQPQDGPLGAAFGAFTLAP